MRRGAKGSCSSATTCGAGASERDPDVLNRTLSLDGQPHLVVGVMPAGFLFPTGKQLHPQIELGPRIDIWRPAAFEQDELRTT